MKVVINVCFGGFGVSKEVYEAMGEEWDDYGYKFNNHRTDPKFISVVEKLGDKANGFFAKLHVVEIPEEATDWRIEEYDGAESIWCVLDGKMQEIW